MPQVGAVEVAAEQIFGPEPIDQVISAYQDAGAMIVRGLIDDHWLTVLRTTYDEMAKEAWNPNIAGDSAPDARKLLNRHRMWEDVPAFTEFLFKSPIAKVAAILMRSKTARLYEDILLTEPAGQPARISWHQDEPTWPVSGAQLSSVWFSMDDVGAESGAMRFVRGSHRGPLYFPDFLEGVDVGDDARFWNGGRFPNDEEIESSEYIIAELRAGDAVVFHPRAIHTSYGSSPDHPRRSFTIRFMGDDVRWLPKKRIFHRWMHDLGLNEGDRITSERLPEVWSNAEQSTKLIME